MADPNAPRRGRRPADDHALFEGMFLTAYTGPDAQEDEDGALLQRKRLLYEAAWVHGRPATVATYKSSLRAWAAWCETNGLSLDAHPDVKVFLYLKNLVEDRAPAGPENRLRGNVVSALESAVKALNLLRRCQPGVPEPHNLTANELIAAVLKDARQRMRALHESSTEIQCIHGTDRLTVAEQERVVEACDARGDALGTHVRAIVNVGIATGMRGDDLARRRFHQIWVDPEPLPWRPTPARVLSMSGRISKANVAMRTQYMSVLRHRNVNLCPVGALAELAIHDLNQPHPLAPTFLDALSNGDAAFRSHRVFCGDLAARSQEQTTDTLRSMYSAVLDRLPDIRANKTKSISILRTTGTSRLVREGCDRASLLNWGRWADHTTADASYVCKEPLSALGANSILAGWGKLDTAQTQHDLGRD